MATSTDKLMRRLFGLERQVRHMSTTPKLGNSSIDDGGSIKIKDPVTGVTRVIIGTQEDGTITKIDLGAPAPPVPSLPVVEETPGALVVGWDGQTADLSAWPLDFAAVEVHATTDGGLVGDTTDVTQVHSFTSIKGGDVTLTLPSGVEVSVWLVAINSSGTESDPTDPVTGTPEDVADPFEIGVDIDTAKAEAIAAAAADATTKADAAESDAIAAAATDATTKANAAQAAAISTASSDATTKANAAQSAAIAAAATDATTKANTAESNATAAAATDATTKANAAQAAAISTAATDATTKANAAQAAAISTASSDATTKANAAQAAAISAAATDATTKANTAESNAISTASSDATTKANAAQAAAIATASSDATTKANAAEAAATAVANTKVKTFAQTSTPTAVGAGDLWMDTDDDNKLYRATAAGTGSWVAVRDTTIAAAASAASTAQSTADGKITTFYATSAPTATAIGDIWFDTDDGNKQYRASATGSGSWVAVRDTTIATAQSTADLKTKTFRQTSIPTAVTIGDDWYDTDDENKHYVAASVGADAITAGEWEEVKTRILSTADSGQRVVVRNDGSGGIIESFSGLSGESPGVLDPTDLGGVPALTIRPGTIPSQTENPEIRMYTGGTDGSLVVTESKTYILNGATGGADSEVFLNGDGEVSGDLNVLGSLTVTGPIIGPGGVADLDDLTDVTLSSPTTGHILRHNGSVFVNVLGSSFFVPASADLSAIAALSPSNDDILQRKAGAWTNRTPAQLKTDLAVNNVDNTSDANKPVSTAQQTALNLKANLASPTFTGTVSGITATMVGAQPVDTDLTTIAGLTPTTDNFMVANASAWASRTPAQAKTSLALVKGDVGLGNVDNTSDANKPVSTAQQTALNLKADDSAAVHKTGAETIAGIKTFSDAPINTYQASTPATPSAGNAKGPYFGADGLPYFINPAGVVLPFSIGEVGTALHSNASFENQTAGIPDSWNYFWQTGGSVATDTSDIVHLTRSMTVSTAAGASNQTVMSDVFTVAPGDTLDVGIWAHKVTGSPRMSIGIRTGISGTPNFFDGVPNQESEIFALPTLYTKYTKRFQVPADHTVARIFYRFQPTAAEATASRVDFTTSTRTGAAVSSFGAEYTSTQPSTPTGGTVPFSRNRGRPSLAFVNKYGDDTQLQSDLWSNNIRMVSSADGGAGTLDAFRCVPTALVTLSEAIQTTTNYRTNLSRYLATTTAVAGNVSGFRVGKDMVQLNTSGRGGFHLCYRIGMETPQTGSRGFFGLYNIGGGSAVFTMTGDPSAKVNIIGFGWDAADTQIQFMRNDGSGTATKTALSAAAFAKTGSGVTGAFWELHIYAPPGGGQAVYWYARELSTGAEQSGTVTTDLPANGTFLAPYAQFSNGSSAAILVGSFQSMYLESDN